MLTITLLGTAATMPLPDRALTAALAECGGHALLFDCGEGTQAAARRAGVNLMKLDAICLTHYHGDHIFGLPGLLQTLGCQGRERPLTLYGPEGLGEVWPALRTLAGPLPYPVRAVQLDTDPIDLTTLSSGWPAGAQLTPFRTRHRVPSRGYRLDLPRAGRFDPAKARALNVPVPAWKLLQRGQSIPLENGAVVAPADVLGPARRGLRFVFSGDTAPCPALEQAAQNADLFLCDATYPDNEQEAQAKQWGHSTLRNVIETPQFIKFTRKPPFPIERKEGFGFTPLRVDRMCTAVGPSVHPWASIFSQPTSSHAGSCPVPFGVSDSRFNSERPQLRPLLSCGVRPG